MIGKPYSGELNVRFDEGELEIGQCSQLRQLSTLPFIPRYFVHNITKCPVHKLSLIEFSGYYHSKANSSLL